MKLVWATAFALTLVVEVPVYLWGMSRRLPLVQAAGLAIGLNLATHPLAWVLGTPGSPGRFVAVEGGVCLTEAVLLWALLRSRRLAVPMTLARAGRLSLVANAFSAGIGLLIVS